MSEWRERAAEHARSWSGKEWGDYPEAPDPGECCQTCWSYRGPVGGKPADYYCKDELAPWASASGKVQPGWWCCFWQEKGIKDPVVFD